MKELQFTITLGFSNKITDDNDIMQIAQNIARAIVCEINNGEGIAPQNSDLYTLGGEVKPQFINQFAPITL